MGQGGSTQHTDKLFAAYFKAHLAWGAEMGIIQQSQAERGIIKTSQESRDEIARLTRHWAVNNVHLVEPLWDAYDVDGDGNLTREECFMLTKDALMASKELAPKLMAAELKTQVKAAQGQIDALAPDERALVEENVARVYDKLRTEIPELIDECLENYDELAVELWQEMDEDSDGSVTKQEFLEHFIVASNRVFAMGSFERFMT